MSWQVALISAQLWLGEITRPRPHKFTFEELLEANKGDETRPIPYIRGRWKTRPQRIWLGDFSVRAVERDSHWTDYIWAGYLAFLLDAITVGYRYYTGQAFALTYGPINRVHQVYVQDLPCAVAPVVDNAGGSILLDDPQLFGGDQPPGAGGIYGICDVIPGTYTQGRNTYLDSLEDNVPALRGVAALVIRGRSGFTESGYFAANGIELREWQVELMAWPDVLNTGNAMLPDQSFNRIHAMYEWATNADFGAEYPASEIHLTSWREAAQTCYDEGLGFSGEINTGGNVGEVFNALRESVDAEVYPHPRDGLKIKLIRKDYSIPLVPVISEANSNSVEEYTPGDYVDSFNKVILNFTNSDNNYQPRPAAYEDPANFQLQRRHATKEIQYPGVATAALAQKLASRDGRALSQPLPPLILNAGAVAEGIWPGDVYHFQWTDPLVRKIMRVHARTPNVSYEGERNFRLTSTEDQYSMGLSVFGAPTGTDSENPADIWETAPPSAEFDDAELPPDGLQFTLSVGIAGTMESVITGAIIFGAYEGGQYARLYVTEPGGVQTLSPIVLSPDSDDKARFDWPAGTSGTYQFCVQTYSLTGATNGVKVCATIGAASFSVSPSASQSPSPSISPSASPSGSASPSASVSPSGSVSPSLSQSPSASQSPSSSASLSQSPSSSTSPSVSPSHSTSPSSSASPSTPAGPEGMANLELWLPISSIVGLNNNDEIVTWPDESGNNRDGTGNAGGISGLKPLYETNIVNGMPAAHFDASGYLTWASFMSGFGDGEMIVAAKLELDAPTSPGPLDHGWGSDTGNVAHFPFTDGTIYDNFGTTARKTTINPTTNLASAWFAVDKRSASGLFILSINGATTGGDFFSTGTNTTGWNNGTHFFGFNGTHTLEAWVVEIILFSRILTADERCTIYDYLNSTYGLAIPCASPSVSPSASVSPTTSPSHSTSPSTSPSSSASPSATVPPSFDAVSSNGGSVVSHSWSHTVTGSETNRILLVFEYYWNGSLGGGARTISSITYNGVALTPLETQINGGAGGRTVEVWYLLNPDTGTHTIAVTGTGASADKQGVGISLYNAAQSAPAAVKASQSNTTPAVTITGSTTDLFIDGVGNQGPGVTLTVGANQTQRANFNQGDQTLGVSTAPGVASESMNWTLSSSTDWAIIAVKVSGL